MAYFIYYFFLLQEAICKSLLQTIITKDYYQALVTIYLCSKY